MRGYLVPALDHPVAAGWFGAAALAQLFACASPASVPATDPSTATTPCRHHPGPEGGWAKCMKQPR